MMFLVAGMLAGRIAGTSWEGGRAAAAAAAARHDVDRLLDHRAPAQRRSRTGYERDDRDSVVVEPYQDLQEIAPAGSMVSCVTDLSHYVQMLTGKGAYGARRILRSGTSPT